MWDRSSAELPWVTPLIGICFSPAQHAVGSHASAGLSALLPAVHHAWSTCSFCKATHDVKGR